MEKITRRKMLEGAGASAAALSALHPRMGNAATKAVNAYVYPISQPTISGPYPEQTIPRYSAANGQLGVAFSGGGPRAFSAAIGQMRGLEAAGVLDSVGAISCVSGGAWFGTTFTYAPTSYSDATLLGPLVQPEDITVSSLKQMPTDYMGSRITSLFDDELIKYAGFAYAAYKCGMIPADRIWSRTINQIFLQPYGLDNVKWLFTLNTDTLASIKQRNRNLSANFYLQRPNRPFLIVGGTQIYMPGQVQQQVKQVGLPGQFYRNIEYTSMYTGAAQLANESSLGTSFGGGFVENFAFDTPAPTLISGNTASVPAGKLPFLLSDMMGSSSAAIAALVNEVIPLVDDPFPRFSYWPISGAKPQATMYSFGDGGILENTGVVSLLRRGYKTIFAFVNSPLEIGSTSDQACMGIDSQISRLFGYIPSNDDGTPQSTQVFSQLDFTSLAEGLKAAKSAKIATVYSGNFPIIENNAFNLAPYTPKIFWIYNDKQIPWMNKLRSAVASLFNDDQYNLGDFPNYDTTFQNRFEALHLSRVQVNLLAHMWAYTIYEGLSQSGYAFGVPIH